MTKRLSKSTSRIILSIVILVAIIGTTLVFNLPSSSSNEDNSNSPVDECGPYQPTDKDVDRTLSLGNKLFDSPDWEESYTVEPYRVMAIHKSVTNDILAQAETLIFTCGYGQEELDNLFGDLTPMFPDYEALNVTSFCERPNDIALYELDLALGGAGYIARLWVDQGSDTRLMTMRLVLLKEEAERLDEFSREIFPEYPSCK
ncbi:MAG: hypothetical protein AB1649_03665 [Chloroflexota bacterium]